MRRLPRVLALLVGCLPAVPGMAQQTLVVHLPSAPIEETNQLAQAVTALGQLLSQATAGADLEVKLFRRWVDAHTYVKQDPQRVVAVLSDTSFLLDLEGLPGDVEYVPTHRFVRSGRETFRRLLVVKASRQELGDLGDLQGRSLSLVETTGKSILPFLDRAIFQGEIGIDGWFSRVVPTTDDFSAVANVLYDQTDAALVSEENPLLVSRLGKDLRQVFLSPPLSRPVLALRQGALNAQQESAWDAVLGRVDQSPGGAEILSALKLDGLRSVPAGNGVHDRSGLLRLPPLPRRTMEIAAPRAQSLSLALPDLPAPQELIYSLAVELPEIPPAADLLADEKPPKPPAP